MLSALKSAALGILALGLTHGLPAQDRQTLWQDFLSPPQSAKPPAPIDLGASRADLDADFQWYRRIGLTGSPCEPPTPTQMPSATRRYMSAEWKAFFAYAIHLAVDCQLEVAIGAEPGFTGTGGPWVQPAQAMKKLVWSQTFIPGGQRFHARLAQPPGTTGPFQDYPRIPSPFEATGFATPQYYADSAVVAFPEPSESVDAHDVEPDDNAATAPNTVNVTSNSGPLGQLGRHLLLGDLQQPISIANAGGVAWVQFAYSTPRSIRSAVLRTPMTVGTADSTLRPPLGAHLEVQDEHGKFRSVATLVVANIPQVTVSFPPVRSRIFRFEFFRPRSHHPLNLWVPPGINRKTSLFAIFSESAPPSYPITELSLHGAGRINEFERKAGFAVADDFSALATPGLLSDDAVPVSQVINLSARMQPDGTLDWTPPPGNWVVLRLGYSLIGTLNYPAPVEATGLEVDQLSARDTMEYVNSYLQHFDFLPRSLMGTQGVRAVFHDSTETGPQNWSPDILERFCALNGYDPHPWLPALTGVILQSPAASDKFLWDFRHTIALLVAEHYAAIAEVAHRHGLQLYSEALEFDRPQLGDDMQMRRAADVPMGAMYPFSPTRGPLLPLLLDERGAASVAHVYGQNIAMAEPFTDVYNPYAFSPRDLKPIADLEFSLGINRLISLGVSRDNTWAEEAGPWLSYLSRTSTLLQKGHFVADVADFYGEDAPLTAFSNIPRLQDVPPGYAFDFINADALLHALDVRDGELVTPSEMHYRVLKLSASRITVPLLRKIRELIEKGAVVVGARPDESPSLADDPREFASLIRALWGDQDRQDRKVGSDSHPAAVRRVGQGMIFPDGKLPAVLAALHIAPDLEFTKAAPDSALTFVHRRVKAGELYYVVNHKDRPEGLSVTFRAESTRPEVWHAESGSSETVCAQVLDGRTRLRLHLDANAALFVLLGPETNHHANPGGQCSNANESAHRELNIIAGPWTVRFQKDRGAPDFVTLGQLGSWSKNSDPAIRYFSGHATYEKILTAPARWFKADTKLWLDLGEVRELARVRVNNTEFGPLWHPPFRVDVSRALRPGQNVLAITVTNLWVNRMIGDAQPDTQQRYAIAVDHPLALTPDAAQEHAYEPMAPLRISGLLGPVRVIQEVPQRGRGGGTTPESKARSAQQGESN